MEATVSDHFARIYFIMNEIGWTLKRVERNKDSPILTVVLDRTQKEGYSTSSHPSLQTKLADIGYTLNTITVPKDKNEIHLDVEIGFENYRRILIVKMC